MNDEGQRPAVRKTPAVPPKTRTIEATVSREQPLPLYHTIVHNCSCHTFDDVIFALMRVIGTGLRDAELKAKEVDFFGSGIVATANLEVAEMYALRLKEVVSASGTLLQTSVQRA